MSLDLTGIQNDNEFYSHHYLSAIFEGDLKDTFKQWQQQEEDYREALKISQEKPDTSSPERAPWIRLRSLSQVFFKLQNQKEKNTAQFNAQLLQTLNYQPQRALKSLEQAGDIPVIAEVTQGLQPIVWVLQAINKDNEQDDPLTLNLQSQQWPTDAIAEPQLLDLSFEDLISKHIFALDKPPRWIILISDQQLLLIDRIKWHEKRLLRFNLDEIFGSKVVLGHCDIKIVGRSRKLRVNYRTTEQIRHTAMAVLEGIPFDDLDNGIDEQKGYRSLMTGAEPLVQCFKSAQEEIDYLIQSLQSLSNEDLEKACLVARRNSDIERYIAAFDAAGIAYYKVDHNTLDDINHDGVRIATMHRVKGLEFDTMYIAGVNDGILPLDILDSDDKTIIREHEWRERSLLYVAITRAKRFCSITGFGKLSVFVE